MSWAFWRNRKDAIAATSHAGAAAAAARGDPATELRARTRRRLIGAAALLLAAVIVLPMVLDSTPRPVPDSVAIDIPSDRTPFAPRLTPPPRSATPAASSASPVDTPGKAGASTAPPVERKPGETFVENGTSAPKELPAAEKASSETTSPLALQAAALASEASARDLVAKLRKAGFAPYTEKVSTKNGEWIRVRVGPYATREAAEAARTKLKALGIQASVVSG